MTPFRRIVVGTDGSDSAWRAVHHAVRLAAKTEAALTVANVYAAPGSARGEHAEVYPGREVGASILRDVAVSFGAQADLRCLLLEGDPADALIGLAREQAADLIVVGNRGLGRRALIGSVPSKVAHRTPCSVLIAQTTGGKESEPYRKVLVGTDGSPTAARAVAEGVSLARTVGADVLLAHAGDRARGEQVLAQAVGEAGDGATTVVEGEPATALIDLARSEDCDLIVVGNKGMTGARRFLSSVPSRVARGAPCHVLLVKTT